MTDKSTDDLLAEIKDLQAQLDAANAKIADLTAQLAAWGADFHYGVTP